MVYQNHTRLLSRSVRLYQRAVVFLIDLAGSYNILKPLLKRVTAHLNHTAELITRFEPTDSEDLKGKIPVSFDVVSLYTNINTEEAIDTALEYTNKYDLYTFGLATQDLYELLNLLLDNNIFRHQELGYFKQIHGLATGNRLSRTLAILCMPGQVRAITSTRSSSLNRSSSYAL